eukprot:COSAG02_NODE_2183_length_9581_cov_22.013394_4_plen_107_part_00
MLIGACKASKGRQAGGQTGERDAAFACDVGSSGAAAGAAEGAGLACEREAKAHPGAARGASGGGGQLRPPALSRPVTAAGATTGGACQSVEATGRRGSLGAVYAEG